MKTDVFSKRRIELGQRYSRTLFVIGSGSEAKRSHSVAYRFKVSSDFYYLTGLEISDALLIVAGKDQYLLTKSNSAEAAVLDDEGFISDKDRAEKLFGIRFENVNRLEDILRAHASQVDRIAFALGRDSKLDSQIVSLASYEKRLKGRNTPVSPVALCDSRLLTGTLRLKKDEGEIALMREAGMRTSYVHTELMKQSVIGRSERDIAHWIESQFMSQGMLWVAYQTIVGSAERSTLLHARATDRIIQDNEFVLVDAGGEYAGYCGDITRVFISGKKFSKAQRDLYNIVLEAQKEIIQAIKPGTDLQELHLLSLSAMSAGLLRQGYDKSRIQDDILKLMPHSTSHWIGLDVHDPSAYCDDSGNALKLEAGMCFTVEPGLYFRSGLEGIAAFKGLGVRIEDDIVVTQDGYQYLTSVPKEVDEIEALRAHAF